MEQRELYYVTLKEAACKEEVEACGIELERAQYFMSAPTIPYGLPVSPPKRVMIHNQNGGADACFEVKTMLEMNWFVRPTREQLDRVQHCFSLCHQIDQQPY